MRRRRTLPLLVAILLIAWQAIAAGGKVNVNSAGAAELQTVPGIDATLAVRIVARRTAQGPFKKPEDLLEVPGFTKLVMVQALDHLEIGAAGPVATAPIGSREARGGKKLDLNHASFGELLLLPGMTARAAKAIVEYREQRAKFNSIDELEQVPNLDKALIVTLLDQVEIPGAHGGSTSVAVATPARTVAPLATPARTAAPANTPAASPAATDAITLGDNGWNGSWVSKLEGTPTPAAEATPKPALAAGEKIDINSADRSDLERLPDVGPVMSQRIVEYRTKNGLFKTVDGLLQVRGIGTQRLAAIRPYVAIGTGARADLTPKPKATPKPTAVAVAATPKPTATPRPTAVVAEKTPRPTPVVAERTPRPTPTAIAKLSLKAILPDGRVNINVASVDDLLTLPRMTRDAANEIVSFRQKNGPFHDVHAITDVPSIGEATYARIHDKITTGGE